MKPNGLAEAELKRVIRGITKQTLKDYLYVTTPKGPAITEIKLPNGDVRRVLICE